MPSSHRHLPFAGTTTAEPAAAPTTNSNTYATTRAAEVLSLASSAPSNFDSDSPATILGPPSTPVNISHLSAELQHHPDQQFAADLLRDLQSGCNIGYSGPRSARITPNLQSAFLHPEAVSDAQAKEVSRGHTAGPFQSPPIANLQCSVLGVVPKKDGTWRIIMDLVVIIMFFLTQNPCTPPYKPSVISLSFFITYYSPVYSLSFFMIKREY